MKTITTKKGKIAKSLLDEDLTDDELKQAFFGCYGSAELLPKTKKQRLEHGKFYEELEKAILESFQI